MKACSVVLVLLLAPSLASAQVNTLAADNPRENARLKLGPFYATPEILLREFGVDSNVFNESGEQRRDFTFTLTPMAHVWVPVARRGLLKADLSSDLVWYREFASERSVDPAAVVRGEFYGRRATFFGQADLLYSRQRPNYEVDLRSRRFEQTWTGGVDVRLTPKLSLEGSGTRATVEFDGDAAFEGTPFETTLNRDRAGYTVTGRYRVTPLTALSIRTERFEDRFPLAPERGSDNVRIMPGVTFQPRALISGSAFVGVRHLNPVDEARLPEFKGLVSDVTLSYTLLGATSISVSHRRDINYSIEPLQPYFVNTSLGTRVRRALGPRFDVVGSIDRYRYAYEEFTAPATGPGVPAPEDRVDTTWNYAASLGYRIGRTGRIGLGVSYWRRDSTTRQFRAYDGLRIGTIATYGI